MTERTAKISKASQRSWSNEGKKKNPDEKAHSQSSPCPHTGLHMLRFVYPCTTGDRRWDMSLSSGGTAWQSLPCSTWKLVQPTSVCPHRLYRFEQERVHCFGAPEVGAGCPSKPISIHLLSARDPPSAEKHLDVFLPCPSLQSLLSGLAAKIFLIVMQYSRKVWIKWNNISIFSGS